MHNAGALLAPLVNDGIRLLIYAGQADMCRSSLYLTWTIPLFSRRRLMNTVVNFIGCQRVLENLQTSYSGQYMKAVMSNFTDDNGDVAGFTKSVGKGAGNVAYVSFMNAGHMVSRLNLIWWNKGRG